MDIPYIHYSAPHTITTRRSTYIYICIYIYIHICIFITVLPIRLLPEDLNKVVKWTKKILVDEGYSMLQLCHIWHVIIRFPDVFYSYRSQLVPQILNCITRIGLPANVASEFRLGIFYYLYVDSLMPLAGLHFCVGLDFVTPSL
jgi:hypothetical protein